MTSGDSSSGRTTADRLRELQRLRDEDLITDGEFESQRARILDQAFGSGDASADDDHSEAAPPAPGEGGTDPRVAQAKPTQQQVPQGTEAQRQARPSAPSSASGARAATDSDPQNPENWPNWLRVLLVIVSAGWLLTIPFLFSSRARRTWLPYAGVTALAVFPLGLFLAVGDTGETPPTSSQQSATSTRQPATPSPQPTATREPTVREQIEDCLSPWDGNHDGFEDQIRPLLNDEGSMRTHATRFQTTDGDGDGQVRIMMEYSANNAFGGRVKAVAIGSLNYRTCRVTVIDTGGQ